MDACRLWISSKINMVKRPLLTEKNVNKYYPESDEKTKGHLNQARKNVRSTKPKQPPFEEHKSAALRGKKEQDVFIKAYDVRETIFPIKQDNIQHNHNEATSTSW
jgi:hypothetical protein